MASKRKPVKFKAILVKPKTEITLPFSALLNYYFIPNVNALQVESAVQ